MDAQSTDEFEHFFSPSKEKTNILDSKIDYVFKNSINFILYDSEKAIAVYPGCIKFGQIKLDGTQKSPECSFIKERAIEIPIHKIKAFVHEIINHFTFFYNKTITKFREVKLCEMNENSLIVTQASCEGQVKFCSFIHKTNDNHVINEIKFTSPENLFIFTQAFNTVILSIATPNFAQEECVALFLRKLTTHPETQCQKLFELWHKGEKHTILWRGIFEALIELDRRPPNNHFVQFMLNFFKNNLCIIHAMFLLKKIIAMK